jgi:hypothetical protein
MLSLLLPPRHPIAVAARVVWCNVGETATSRMPRGFGVQFLSLDPVDRIAVVNAFGGELSLPPDPTPIETGQ